jgi:outer membrane protein assembly factor BamE (lipoprotein component of BamABCDE complex)
MKRTVLLLALSGLVCLAASGCNKFSKKRYMTIQPGMNKLTVEKILGPPTAKFSDSWTYVPEKFEGDKDYYFVTIHFAGDQVTKKTWSDKNQIADNPDGKKPVGPAQIIVD